jgi:hypothetical protein
MKRLVSLALLGLLAFAPATQAADGPVAISDIDGGKRITIDGKLFAEYRTDLSTKPVIWPIIGPNGASMTRDYPLAEREGEQKDHPHHTGMWFTHEGVGGANFWHQGDAKQVHREWVESRAGEAATIVTRNDWLNDDGKKVAEDIRTITFRPLGQARAIDYDVKLTATEKDIEIGDSKEGTFGIRVPSTMVVDRKNGTPGTILNSRGQKNGEAWGKAASWVDYSGEVQLPDGDTDVAGIAMMNHPTSFRYPTHWHVRTYGLFAANPFGLKAFKAQDEPGTVKLAQGESLQFSYRVVFHAGNARDAAVEELFQSYAENSRTVSADSADE